MHGVLLLLAAGASAKPRPVTYSTGCSFVATCNTSDTTPQICDPPRKLKVEVKHGTC